MKLFAAAKEFRRRDIFSLKRNKNVNSFQKMKLFVKYVDTAAYKYYNSAGNVSKTLFHRGKYGKLIVKARM